MNWKKSTTLMIAVLLMAVPVMAQEELPDPGITPDSPFYFVDQLFSVFKSPAALADERAAEAVAMAHKNHERGLAKALAGYEKALQKRQAQADRSAEDAEAVATQTSNHLIALARAREQVPAQAQAGLDRALDHSARGRENALASLEQHDPAKATAVAQETLQRVMARTPEAAQAGLTRALTAMQRRGAPADVEITPEMRKPGQPAEIEGIATESREMPEQAAEQVTEAESRKPSDIAEISKEQGNKP